MKKNQKNSTGILLVAVQTEKNQKQKRIENFIDGLLVWIFAMLTGIAVCNMFGIKVNALPAIAGIVFAVYLSFEAEWKGKLKKYALLAEVLVLILVLLLFHKTILDGWNLFLNQILDEIKQHLPYIYPQYPVSDGDLSDKWKLSVTMAVLVVVIEKISTVFIKMENRWITGLIGLMWITLQIVLGFGPSFVFNVVFSGALLLIWFRMHRKEETGSKESALKIESACFTAGMILVATLIFMLLVPEKEYSKNETVSKLEASIKEKIEDWRYGGSYDAMPKGDFEGLSSLKLKDDAVLEVTMSDPQSYYLRGYTGSVYNKHGWETTDKKVLYNASDLFYWLHQDGFFGQETLPLASLALDETTKEEPENTVTIKNLKEDSRYLYTPYELIGTTPDKNRIGDEGVAAKGLKGQREYTYTALENQIKKYPSLTAKLADTENLDEEGKAYSEKEAFYNQYVYETDLELPESVETELKEVLGEYTLANGSTHFDYTKAKQNILYVLSSRCTYSEEIKKETGDVDFLTNFLENTKKGYSVHYATAAALMFRYYKIPARYVEGYVITPDDVKSMKVGEPYTVDGTHAHAWVEYYQDGVGWLPFESTPSYLGIMATAEEYQDISGITSGIGADDEQEQQDEQDNLEDEEQPEEEDDEIDWILILEMILGILIVLITLFLILIIVKIIRERIRCQKIKQLFDSEDYNQAVNALFEYTMNILAVFGLKVRNASLYRYGSQIESLFDEEMKTEYTKVVDIRQEAVYSSHSITKEQRDFVMEFKNKVWEKVYKEAGWLERFQLKFIYFL